MSKTKVFLIKNPERTYGPFQTKSVPSKRPYLRNKLKAKGLRIKW
jgi:hypothetical protein